MTNQRFSDKCEVDTEAQTIIIRGAFTQSAGQYSSLVTISLEHMINPVDSRRQDTFELSTFSDE